MKLYAILLCSGFVMARGFALYWSYKPVQHRPPLVRHGEALGLISLVAMIALVAGFFAALNFTQSWLKPCLAVLAVLIIDWGLRRWFFELEVRRLCGASAKHGRRSASRRVRRRATARVISIL